jgi:hypothetical protein
MKTIINIPVSSVAILIGLNKYQKPSDILIEHWQKIQPEKFNKINDFYKKKLELLIQENNKIINKLVDINNEIDNINQLIILEPQNKNKYLKLLDSLNKEHNTINDNLKLNNETIEINKNIEQKSDKNLQSEIIYKYKIDASSMKFKNLSENRKSMDTFLQKIPDEEKEQVKKVYTNLMNFSHGNKSEKITIHSYSNMTEKDIITPKKNIIYNIYEKDNIIINLVGRADGIYYNDANEFEIIEIKNRANKLFGLIPDYEKVQIALYKLMYSNYYKNTCRNCELVEQYNEKINILPFNPSDEYIQNILHKLNKYIEFVNVILNNDENAVLFLLEKKNERDNLIYNFINS